MDALRAADLRLVAEGVLAGGAAAVAWGIVRPRLELPVAVGATAMALAISPPARTIVHHGHLGARTLVVSGALALAGAVLAARRSSEVATWLPAAVLVSAIAAWAAVPETSVVLVAGGIVAPIALGAVLAWRRATGLLSGGLAVLVVAAALFGDAPTDVRRAGAAACLGLLLWWVPGQLLRAAIERVRPVPGLRIGPGVLVAHAALALVAARWIGVAGDASWSRVVALAVVGTAVAAACRPRAIMER